MATNKNRNDCLIPLKLNNTKDNKIVVYSEIIDKHHNSINLFEDFIVKTSIEFKEFETLLI